MVRVLEYDNMGFYGQQRHKKLLVWLMIMDASASGLLRGRTNPVPAGPMKTGRKTGNERVDTIQK